MLQLLTTIALLYVAWTITSPLARAAFASALRPAPLGDRFYRMVANEVGGIAWELITGFVTAPSGTQTNLTMATGDSLAVRAAAQDKLALLVNLWVDSQTTGIVRVKSPRMHDNVQGIRAKTVASEAKVIMPWGRPQRVYPTDVLSADLSGSATAGDIETAALLFYYEDLPGVTGKFIKWDEAARRGVNVFTCENTVTTGAGGGWTGSVAINASFDLFKANTDYALLGYEVDVECAAVAFRGVDTGNLRVGGPGDELARHVTGEWFKRLSLSYDLPAIPVFNSLNKGGITVEAAQDENAAAVRVNSLFVELAPR